MRRIAGIRAALFGLALLLGGGDASTEPVRAADTRGVGIVQIRDAGGKEVGLYSESHALVIGAVNYTNGWPKLPGVEKDVAAVKDALEAQGFAVEVLADPTRERLERAFTEFINRHGMRQENRLLFYFAGHGHTIKQSYGEEMGYIVPVDAPNPNTDRDGFLARAVDMQLIEVYAKRIQAKHALFLFDSCFSGQIFALSRAVPENISYKTAQPVRQFITSGSAEEQVPDRSIFREQLVSALQGDADRNGDRYVTGTELGEYLQERVTNYSKGAQHPQYGKIRNPNLDRGDFIFLAGGGSVIEETPAAPAAVKPTTGSLTVQTRPGGAAVSVNGARRGKAPLTLENLSPGPLAVRAEYEGYDPQEETVLVRAGKAMSLTLVLERTVTAGSVVVTSEPVGAKWYLDGAYAGTTPDRLPDVAPGSHRVTVQADGYGEWSGSVTVSVGEESQVSAKLGAQPAPAVVAPSPSTGGGGASPGQLWREPTTGMEFVWVPGGCFQMGSPTSEAGRSDDEGPQHEVCVDGFWMGKTEVTNAQYRRYKGRHDSGQFEGKSLNGDTQPVVNVSWDDVQAYAQWLRGQTGKQIRLPTEAEWEYAARGGTRNARYWGEDSSDTCRFANVRDRTSKRVTSTSTWEKHNCDDGYAVAAPVGSYQANSFGLYDMLGNVWEWCSDWYGGKYYGGSSRSNPTGPTSGAYRVLRGGGWNGGPGGARSAIRFRNAPASRFDDLGFRLVLSGGQR